MAPAGVDAVDKMGIYSEEFNAGQPGFLLIESDIYADPDPIPEAGAQKDPFYNLKGIEQLETKCNSVDNTTAVSIVFLMKAIGVGVNVSGTPVSDLVPDDLGPVNDIAELIFDREQT